MAAKKKVTKLKTQPKKMAATALKSVNSPTASAPVDFTSFSKAFSQFPQFKPLKMETSMFKNDMFKGNKQIEKMTQDATVMGQDQMEAIVKASSIFAKGMEDMMKVCMEILQSVGEKNQNAAKSMMSCKTLNEFTDLQTRLAQSSFDEFMTNATKISEKTVKLCTESMEPINNQMGKTMRRASETMAA